MNKLGGLSSFILKLIILIILITGVILAISFKINVIDPTEEEGLEYGYIK